ncbi:MAG: hypothetical protein GY943_08365 [Chloroflexi bacterium]|nr:hypothetical protein [Chloroflexota bacterium]
MGNDTASLTKRPLIAWSLSMTFSVSELVVKGQLKGNGWVVNRVTL